MSSELETTSFFDSDEDDSTSRWGFGFMSSTMGQATPVEPCLGGMWALCWEPGPCSASYGAVLGQPGGERLWAPQVQQLHRAEQRLTPDAKTQTAAAEAEGVPD